LEDNEMFLNENGDPMDIEVRGEKTMKGAYFKAYDLGKAFDYSKLTHVVVDPRSKYVYGKHFVYVRKTIRISDSRSNQVDEQNNDKNVLYLTYMGVLKVLFCARGNKAERFQEWATRILFTMQMGGQDDKDALAAEALNVDQSTITQIFRKSARAIPCVYLFEVGTVGNMRQHFNLDENKNDEDKVYKYGMSSDMARRASEHSKTYGKLKDNSF
jgi:prophage antirepressor-like protein